MQFEIDITLLAEGHLNAIRVFDRRRIIDAIERNLVHQPNVISRNRKRLDEAKPPFEHVPPLWELRIGEFRVYYDVDITERIVSIRAALQKPPHLTTKDVFYDEDDSG